MAQGNNMASSTPENTPDLAESPAARREQLTQALLEMLEGEDSESKNGDRQSHASSQLRSLRSESLWNMLAAFVTMTTHEIRELQERVQHLEAALQTGRVCTDDMKPCRKDCHSPAIQCLGPMHLLLLSECIHVSCT